MMVDIDISRKVFNSAYLNYLFSYENTPNYRYILLLGGAGSGKSVFITQRTILRILKEPNHRILVVRKVASTIRNSVYRLFKDIISQWKIQQFFNFSDSYLTIRCTNGAEIIFVGLDNVEKMKSIAGITSIWIEEATELTQTDLNQLDLRLRGNSSYHKEVVLSFNPISQTHWIKKRFYDKTCVESVKIKTTYKDNRFLDEKYVEVLNSLKDTDPVYYSVYCLGEWGSTGNLIWSNYKIENIELDDEYYDHIYCGLDFGYNDPAALVKIGVKDSELYILKEFYQTKLTNTQLIERLQDFKSYRMTADNAEPARIKEFKQVGFNITACKKGKHSIKHGIDFVRGKKIYINPSCRNFIKEIQGYVYLQDKDGTPTEEPIGTNDHLMSALRYGIEPLNKQDSIMFLK